MAQYPIIPGLPIGMPEVLISPDEIEENMTADRLQQHPLRRVLEQTAITPDTIIPKRTFLFTIFSKPCFAQGELVAVTGKAKSGKTFFCSALLAAGKAGECLGIRRTCTTAIKALWIDTEQSEESTQEILVSRISVLAHGEPLPQVYNLRGITWDQRMAVVEAAIEVHCPELVVFDGIRDVVADINDGVTAQRVVERTMRLASGDGHRPPCCIVCVLHQNKAAEDSTLRGALGTELMNKCFETYECKKQEGGIFQVEQTATRKFDIREKLQFTVADNGLPVTMGAAQTGEMKYLDINGRIDARLLFGDCIPEGYEIRGHLLKAWAMQKAGISEARFAAVKEEALMAKILQKRKVSEREVYFSRGTEF